MQKVKPPNLEYFTLNDLVARWEYSLDRCFDFVLNQRLKVYAWGKVDGEFLLLPVPVSFIHENFNLIPNEEVSLENKRIAIFPENQVLLSGVDVEGKTQEFFVRVEFKETYVSELLVKLDEVTKLESESSNQNSKDTLVIDVLGMVVQWNGKNYNFTAEQIKFLKILAEQKRAFLNGKVPVPSIRGLEVLEKINSTSKRTSDFFRQNIDGFYQITVNNKERKKGVYILVGSEIKIVGVS